MSNFPVYISLGSNIDPAENIKRAVSLLSSSMEIDQIARVWETPAVGTIGPNFYNTALSVHTSLSPIELKRNILRPIETQIGRIRMLDKYAPRTIDLDVVVYNYEIIDPRLWVYAYLALPISELIPDLINSENGETLAEIALCIQRSSPAILHPEITF